MIAPYILRLISLCAASFFVIHLALGLGVSVAAPLLVRCAKKMNPRRATSLLLAARFMPAGLSFLLIAVLCAPSYLLLEPDGTSEELSLLCLVTGGLCVLIWSMSIGRGIAAFVRSCRYDRLCHRAGRARRLAEDALPALLIDAPVPVMAMSGVFRPQLVVSRKVLDELEADQLSVALLHERAHRDSRDNLKRLLLLLAPGLLPFFRGFDGLELAWGRMAEWAADDRAAAGDVLRPVALAAALVSVSRMGAAAQTSPLCTSLVPDPGQLTARVNRLLCGSPPAEERPWPIHPVLLAFAGCALGIAYIASQAIVLQSVHLLMEHLTR